MSSTQPLLHPTSQRHPPSRPPPRRPHLPIASRRPSPAPVARRTAPATPAAPSAPSRSRAPRRPAARRRRVAARRSHWHHERRRRRHLRAALGVLGADGLAARRAERYRLRRRAIARHSRQRGVDRLEPLLLGRVAQPPDAAKAAANDRREERDHRRGGCARGRCKLSLRAVRVGSRVCEARRHSRDAVATCEANLAVLVEADDARARLLWRGRGRAGGGGSRGSIVGALQRRYRL